MSFEILNDFPMPHSARGAQGSKYPFDRLEVGQAFVVPAADVPGKGITSIRAAINGFRGARGEEGKALRFTPRLLEDGSIGVWRTA